MSKSLFCACPLGLLLLLAAPAAHAADEPIPTAASGRAALAAESKPASNSTTLTNLSTNGLGAAAGSNLLGATVSTNTAGTNTVRFTSSWGQKLKQGGVTALVQIAVSIFGAGFIFERLFRLRRQYINPEGLAAKARELWKAGKFEELEKFGESNPSTLGRVIAFIAKNRQAPMLEVSEICGDLVSRELTSQYQRAYPLGIVATLEPLLGLLGMILGMIQTFETVALAGALGEATHLAAAISEALVTTGLGLAIAIPFLALYHVFKFKTTGFGAMLEEEVTSLLSDWLMKKEPARAK